MLSSKAPDLKNVLLVNIWLNFFPAKSGNENSDPIEIFDRMERYVADSLGIYQLVESGERGNILWVSKTKEVARTSYRHCLTMFDSKEDTMLWYLELSSY